MSDYITHEFSSVPDDHANDERIITVLVGRLLAESSQPIVITRREYEKFMAINYGMDRGIYIEQTDNEITIQYVDYHEGMKLVMAQRIRDVLDSISSYQDGTSGEEGYPVEPDSAMKGTDAPGPSHAV